MRKPISFWTKTLQQLGLETRSVSEGSSGSSSRRSRRRSRSAQLESLEARQMLASVSVYASAGEISESSPGSPVTFTFQATETMSTSLTVYYYTSGSATDGDDYTKAGGGSVSSSIMIPSGSSSATISVVPVDDSDYEGTEDLTINLSASGYDLGYSSSATVTITDNDSSSSTSNTVSVTASPTTIYEMTATYPTVFTFERTGNSASSLTVYYYFSGDATNGNDYVDQATNNSVSGSIVIPANSTSATISVVPVDDTEVDGTEAFTLNLSASGYLLGTSSSASVTIEDNDVGSSSNTVNVTVSPSTINEGSTSSPAVFTITREGSSASSLTLYYFLTGDATNYTDYRDQATGNSLSGSITIPANSTSATISVVPVDNSEDAPNKSFALNLYESGCVLGSSSTASVTIEDDDLPTVNVWASPSTIYEQSASSPAVLTFQRAGDLTNSLTVYFTLGGSATNGDDYRDQSTSTSVASSIVIPAGSSSATLSIVPVDDEDSERNENLTLALSASGVTLGSSSSATVSIFDDDIGVFVDDITVTEGTSSSSTSAAFVLRLTAPSDANTTLSYKTVNGDAVFASDYASTSSSITILAGSTSATITVPIDADDDFENDELFGLQLFNVSGAGIADGFATATIVNDDIPPAQSQTVSVRVDRDLIRESNSSVSANFTITRDQAIGDLVVNYEFTGDADFGDDFEAPTSSGSVTIFHGSYTATIQVTAVDDLDNDDDDDDVTFSLASGSGYSISASYCSATVRIEDNEGDSYIDAIPDEYVTFADDVLEISASDGVLANDMAPGYASVVAELLTTVQHGTLQLHTDGSFSYDPDGYEGEDSFEYRVNADGNYSGSIFVALTSAQPVLQIEIEPDTWVPLVEKPEFWVGEFVRLRVDMPLTLRLFSTFDWAVAGNAFADYLPGTGTGEVIPLELHNNVIKIRWVDGGDHDVDVGITTAFGEPKTRSGTIHVRRPIDQALSSLTTRTFGPYLDVNGVPWVQFGRTEGAGEQIAGIEFHRFGEDTPNGDYFFLQTVDMFMSLTTDEGEVFTQSATSVLDAEYPYEEPPASETEDSPGAGLPPDLRNRVYQATFKMYVMWQSKTAFSAPVPMTVVEWEYGFEATSLDGFSWFLVYSNASDSPTGSETFSHPQWKKNQLDVPWIVQP